MPIKFGFTQQGIHLLSIYAQKYGDERINERLAEQQFFINELTRLLEKYEKDKKIDDILNQISVLEESLNHIKFEYIDAGKPWKTVDTLGNEVWYQPQKSIAKIDSSHTLKISKEVEKFRNEIFKLTNDD